MKLNEICEVYSGYALKKFNDIKDGMPVVKIGNIHVDGTLNLEMCQYTTEDVDKKYYSNKGDVYIALSGATTGKVGIMDTDDTYVINQRVGIIRQKNNGIPQEYIKYFLLRQTDRIFKEATGCAQPNISPKQIADYIVPDISKEKMYEICGIFNKIKKIIDSRNAEISALDNLIKARFVEMFGDPRSNPFGFKKMILKDTCKIITGNTPSRAVDEYYGEFIEWIKTDNIVSGLLYPTKATEGLSEIGVKIGRTVDKDSILMACIAGSIASIGRVCITDRRVAFNQQINAIIPQKYNIHFLYVLLQISKDYLVEDINMALKGILSKSKLEEKEFVVPPRELQEQFAEFVHRVDKSKVVYMYILKTRKYLMYNGEYREKVNCI